MKTNNWFILDNKAIDEIRAAVSEPITQGEMMLRASCARKWYYRYVLRLEKRGLLDYNLIYGSLMHKLMQVLYDSKDKAFTRTSKESPIKVDDSMLHELTEEFVLKPTDHAELELVRDKVQIAFDAYRVHYQKLDSHLIVQAVEKTIELEFGGLKFVGKIDMIAKPNNHDGIFIWDWKTAGQLDAMSLDAFTFRFQFLFYCWLYWRTTGTKPIGTMINGLLKSQLRPRIADRKTKQLETQKEYLFRIKGDMIANREKYFYRQRLPLGTDALERFENEILLPHLDGFSVLGKEFVDHQTMNALAFQMNTNQCHVYKSYCEYLSLCKDGRLALGEFDKREVKHPEISDLTTNV